jgi:hypothetical protein
MKKDRWDLLKNGVPSGYREAVEFYIIKFIGFYTDQNLRAPGKSQDII